MKIAFEDDRYCGRKKEKHHIAHQIGTIRHFGCLDRQTHMRQTDISCHFNRTNLDISLLFLSCLHI